MADHRTSDTVRIRNTIHATQQCYTYFAGMIHNFVGQSNIATYPMLQGLPSRGGNKYCMLASLDYCSLHSVAGMNEYTSGNLATTARSDRMYI